eukprot:5395803-Karenia_brevis.AAC.1
MAVNTFLNEQNWLSVHFLTLDATKYFQVTFKSNLFWHLAQQSEYCNLRLGWVYKEEDFVGRVDRIAASVVYGRGAVRLGKSLGDKWCRLQWYRRRRRELQAGLG